MARTSRLVAVRFCHEGGHDPLFHTQLLDRQLEQIGHVCHIGRIVVRQRCLKHSRAYFYHPGVQWYKGGGGGGGVGEFRVFVSALNYIIICFSPRQKLIR